MRLAAIAHLLAALVWAHGGFLGDTGPTTTIAFTQREIDALAIAE